MAFKEKQHKGLKWNRLPSEEEAMRINLQELDKLQGWREATGDEKKYIQGRLWFLAERQKKGFKLDIALAALGVGMIWFIIDSLPGLYEWAINRRDVLEIIKTVVCGVLLLGIGVFLVSFPIQLKTLSSAHKFATAISEGAFRVIDVKVSNVCSSVSMSYTPGGRDVQVIDMSGNQFKYWLPSHLNRNEYAILVHMLNNCTAGNMMYVMPRFNLEDKFCKNCLEDYEYYR